MENIVRILIRVLFYYKYNHILLFGLPIVMTNCVTILSYPLSATEKEDVDALILGSTRFLLSQTKTKENFLHKKEHMQEIRLQASG